jgi:tetratricopeptide (TPR) repeat protein
VRLFIRKFGKALPALVVSLSIFVSVSLAQTLNCLGTSASDNPASRAEVDRGVEAYKGARYDEAILHFEKATNLAPCLTMARLYLATAQAQNVVPNLNTPDNLKIAEQAIGNFQTVLTQDLHNVNSLKQVASIYFNTRKLDEAHEWQMKVLAEDPKDYEAAYTICVIDWTKPTYTYSPH